MKTLDIAAVYVPRRAQHRNAFKPRVAFQTFEATGLLDALDLAMEWAESGAKDYEVLSNWHVIGAVNQPLTPPTKQG